MPIKNKGLTVSFFVTESGVPKTGDEGNLTLRRIVDGVASTIAASPAEVDATNAKGWYRVVLTDAENSGDMMNVAVESSTSDVYSAGVSWTNEVNIGAVSEDEAAADNLEAACDNYTAERGLAGTALPAAAADAPGGLPISDAGGLDMDALSTYDGSDTAGVSELLTRLTVARSLLMDNMDVALSTIQSQIVAINNLSAKCNWFGSTLLEVPEGMATRTYIFELVVKDDEDKLVNLDAAPTITLVNASGTDRSALITSAPLAGPTATGRYEIEMTVAVGSDNESLTLRAEGAVGGDPRYAMLGLQVVDYDTSTKINEILTKLGTPAVTVSDDIAALPSAGENKDALVPYFRAFIRDDLDNQTNNSAAIADINADLGLGGGNFAPGMNGGGALESIGDDSYTLLGRIPAALFSGITSLAQWLGTLAGKSTADPTALAEIQATNAGTNYSNASESLEAILDRGNAAWVTGSGGGGGGGGARTVSCSAQDSDTNPLQGVTVQIRDANTNALIDSQTTDASGNATPTADDGTYNVHFSKSGYASHVESGVVVNADTTIATVTLTTISLPAPSAPGLCALSGYFYLNGSPLDGVTFRARFSNGVNQTSDGVVLNRSTDSASSDAAGLATLELVKLSEITVGDGLYEITAHDSSDQLIMQLFTKIPDDDSKNIEDLINTPYLG